MDHCFVLQRLTWMDIDVLVAKLEWMDKRQTERHSENVDRLTRIESEVRATNGRVNRHDSEIMSLKIEQERLARAKATDRQEQQDMENSPMSFKSARAIIGYIAAAVGAFYMLLTQIMGFHR